MFCFEPRTRSEEQRLSATMNKTSTFREKYQQQMPEKNSGCPRGFKNLPSLPSELLLQSHLQLTLG